MRCADEVCIAARLPQLRRGDLLAVFDNGAYCESVTSDYCSVPLPAAVLVDDGRAACSRRRETVADIEGRFSISVMARCTRRPGVSSVDPRGARS